MRNKVLRTSLFSATLVVSLLASTTSAFALTLPTFPACETPHGSVLASNGQGNHGIAGSNSDHTGTDIVYSVSGKAQATQCFCGTDSHGIQTDWLNVTGYSDGDLDFLRRSGWVFIPDGKLWGLDSGPYMTHNSNYTCGTGGAVLGISDPGGEVLGLADTGTARQNLIAAAGLSFIIAGVFLVSKSRRSSEKQLVAEVE